MAYKDKYDPRAREARLKHYHDNKEQYLERNKKAKQEKRAYLDKVKNVPCADCGKQYPPYVMDMDHREPGRKTKEVSRLIGNGWEALKKEIAKCDVVCANCHRERTYGQSSAAG